MQPPDLKNLKYGIIYIYSDPERMTMLHGSADLLRKIVYPMDIEWVDDPGRDGALIVARRFNVGNIGQYATVALRTSQYNRRGGQLKALHHFTDVLMGMSDTDSGNILIDEDDFNYESFGVKGIRHFEEEAPPMPCATPQDHTRVKPKFARWKGLKKRMENILEEDDNVCMSAEDEDEYYDMPEEASSYSCQCKRSHDDLQEEENLELARIERERERALERIRRDIVNYIARYHDDPTELMIELLQGKVVVGQPGRLLVNGDLKIVLPEYDEMEIEMPAMCRTLYILFMKLRRQGDGGIVLRNIDEYRDEILDIYSMVKPGANEKRVKRSVDNLCDPFGDTLNQMISRINHCIRNVITDKELVKQYTITGTKGEEYSIALDPQYLELPRAVMGS